MSSFVLLVLTIIAIVLIGLAAFGVTAPRVNLAWLGVAIWLVAWAGTHLA